MLAGASDLPQELFRNVLYFVAADSRGRLRSDAWELHQMSKEDKQDLGACILTCADWATQCRGLLYLRVTVKSAEDVRALTSFATSPPSARYQPVTNYTSSITIYCMPDAKPWLHHVYPLLDLLGHRYDSFDKQYMLSKPPLVSTVSKMSWVAWWTRPGYLGLSVVVCPRSDEGPRLWQSSSLHGGLPRSLPSRYHAFSYVTVEKLHFQSLAVLLRVLKELTNLRNLYLRGVTWAKEGVDMTFAYPVRFAMKGDDLKIEAKGCTDDALLAMLVLCEAPWAFRRRDNVTVTGKDVHHAIGVINWVCTSVHDLKLDGDRVVHAHSCVFDKGSMFISLPYTLNAG